MKTIYLCGPIDGVSPDWATGWRREVKECLTGWNVLDPTEGKDLHNPATNDNLYTPEEIVEGDLAMIKQADVLLVDWRYVPKGIGAPLRVGTVMEICYAKQWGKQVVTFGDLKRGYWMRYHADKHFGTVDEAVEFLLRGGADQ